MKINLTASKLKFILVFVLVLTVSLTIAGFYFAQTQLTNYAKSISQLNADANAGDDNIAQLQKIRDYLDKKQSVIEKANSIVADSKSYAYQDQIIDDIVAIGDKANISITGFDFASGSSGSTGEAATITPAPATEPSAPVAAPSSGALPSIKSTIANVTIDSTADYNNIMSFIKGIERNPTKMQIQDVSLVKDTGNKVTSKSFSVEVYIR